MPGYEVKLEPLTIAKQAFQIHSLKDRQQYYDPDGDAERRGIYSSNWSLFGVVWPSEIVLARIISALPLGNSRVLEVGCGIAIASMVASHMGANITASDYHPLAESFLEKNTELNQIPGIPFMDGDWRAPNAEPGAFDLIIGSDLLYEPHHPDLLSKFIDSHAATSAKIIIIDPGRRQLSKFTKQMELYGFSSTSKRITEQLTLDEQYKGKMITYERS